MDEKDLKEFHDLDKLKSRIKKNNKWKMIMEYQKSRTTAAEWNTL